MGDTARQGPQAFHLPGLLKLGLEFYLFLFCLLAIGDVVDDAKDGVPLRVVFSDRLNIEYLAVTGALDPELDRVGVIVFDQVFEA